MFGSLFGWRKACKCKKMIKQLQCRLKLLKKKRSCIMRLLREDIAQLIKIGREEIAFNRAEQLVKDENMMELYEILDIFCDLISTNLKYIHSRRHKDCPNHLIEPVSSLIFASSRCGDLPELIELRKLFGERYGQKFAVTAADLLPGNRVNREVIENLSIKSVSDDKKHQLVDEIANNYCLRPEILALEKLQQQLHQMQGAVWGLNNMQHIYVDSSPTSKTISPRPNQTHSQLISDAVSTSISSSIVQPSSPELVESPKGENFAQREERMSMPTTPSSSESDPQFSEGKFVSLDDNIEELQSSSRNDDGKEGHDKRLFGFNPKTDNADSSRSSRNSVKAPRKQSRRRSSSRENRSIKDVQCEVYYDKSASNKHRSSNHHERKHQKQSPIKQSSYAHKRLKQNDCLVSGSDLQSSNCRTKEMERPLNRNEQMEKTPKEKQMVSDTPSPSISTADAASRIGKISTAPYLKAMTMPPERSKESRTEKILRCNSMPFPKPEHVHPKLPEYDDLAAKFLAIKKERLQKHC